MFAGLKHHCNITGTPTLDSATETSNIMELLRTLVCYQNILWHKSASQICVYLVYPYYTSNVHIAETSFCCSKHFLLLYAVMLERLSICRN